MSDGAARLGKAEFLAQAGWGDAAVSRLAGDASNRRYDRVRRPCGARAVLMDAPAARGEDIGVFLAFTGWLRAQGFSAPKILHADIANGWALIEDLGDALYARVCAERPEAEPELYAAAVDLLSMLHDSPPPARATGGGAAVDVAPYDEPALEREAMLALDWWRAGVLGRAPEPALAAEYGRLVLDACAGAAGDRRALVLRDYHAENLIWLPDRRGAARVGLLDYQDALIGSPAYDLVSLLEDARRDTSTALREDMIARYAAARGLDAAGREAFAAAYAALGAQRNLKIIGIFARLRLRDGKAGYLSLIPRVWAHLERDLAHPRLSALAAFVRAEIPAPTPERLETLRGAGA